MYIVPLSFFNCACIDLHVAFHPPQHLAGIKALLDHSVQNYGPLPSELRPRRMRSRTQSRPSPYPQSRAIFTPSSPLVHPSPLLHRTPKPAPVLQQMPTNKNVNVMSPRTAPSSLSSLKPFSPLVVEQKCELSAFGLVPAVRPLGLVGSTPRKTTAPGARSGSRLTKRSTGKSSGDQKENVVGQGSGMVYVSFPLYVTGVLFA